MKEYNAIYKYGNVYDAKTGNRILIAEGSVFTASINESDILSSDPYNKEYEIRSAEAIVMQLRKNKYREATKVLKAGMKIYFDITAGFKGRKQQHLTCDFEVTLQEDLFIARRKSGTKYSIISCYCIVEKCLSGNLEFFEPIHASSLNNAYMKTYDFYFRLFGSPTANARAEFRRSLREEPGFLKQLCAGTNKPELILDATLDI